MKNQYDEITLIDPLDHVMNNAKILLFHHIEKINDIGKNEEQLMRANPNKFTSGLHGNVC